HGRPQRAADLEGVRAVSPGDCFRPLVLLRNLALGQKVGRAKEAKVGELGQRNAAGNGRIVGDAGHEFVGRVFAERILLGVREVADETETGVADERWSEDVRPAEDEAVGFECLAAPSGSGSAVGDATEKAGDKAGTVGVTETAE